MSWWEWTALGIATIAALVALAIVVLFVWDLAHSDHPGPDRSEE